MYFNFLPSLKYDVKPISYPFSESDYVIAKNFFKRYKISDTAFNSAVYYNKYAIGDEIRLDQIAEKAYGQAEYDWVIALVNNMINPLYDLPMSENDLRKHVESSYENPYYDIHHYETISNAEQKELFGKVLIEGGTWVDETFYNSQKNLVADTFPNLTPSSESLPIVEQVIFDQTINNITNVFGPVYLDSSTLTPPMMFNPPLSEDGYRARTQLVFGQGINGQSAGEEQRFEVIPLDFTSYDTLEVYVGQTDSPLPGDTFEVGYKDSNSDFVTLASYNLDEVIERKIITLPEEIKTINQTLIFRVLNDSSNVRDTIAVQSIKLEGTITQVYPLGFDYNKINDDNYIIDGVEWVRVDGTWYRKIGKGFLYWNGTTNVEIPGNQLSKPISEFEYESNENEKKRELYLLKPEYLTALVDDFRKASLYKKSSDFVSNKLKKSGV